MDIETTGAEAPAGGEAIAEPTPVDTSETTTTEQTAPDSAAEQPEADHGDDAAAAPRKKPGVHNRIDELTRQKHDALRDAQYWRQKAEELSSKNTADMDYDDQLVTKMRRESASERADAASMTAQQAVAQQFALLEGEARSKWTDYDQVTRNPSIPITQEMAALIAESDVGPEVAYHLGKNPQEAARLAQMTDKQLAKEVGRLEARLTLPKAPPKQPPAPVQPVSGIAAGGSKDPGTMSMSEYAAWRKANT